MTVSNQSSKKRKKSDDEDSDHSQHEFEKQITAPTNENKDGAAPQEEEDDDVDDEELEKYEMHEKDGVTYFRLKPQVYQAPTYPVRLNPDDKCSLIELSDNNSTCHIGKFVRSSSFFQLVLVVITVPSKQ